MEGHGTNASTKYLSIYELTDRLIERKRITLSEGAGMMARWTYQYAVATPSAGGILLTLTLTIDGTPDPEFVVPKKMKTVTVGSAH
jgi:hypothetical protein